MAAAREIGYPVALKAAGPEILHKSDVGGVILDLRDEASLRSAHHTLAARLGNSMTATLVQQMVSGGVELLSGGVVDPTFGPLVACGSGGVLVDLLGDTVFRLHPLTDLTAAEMVESLKSVRLLRGYRGRGPADERAAVHTLLRVSALMTIGPEIQEIDINPLKVLERGVRSTSVCESAAARRRRQRGGSRTDTARRDRPLIPPDRGLIRSTCASVPSSGRNSGLFCRPALARALPSIVAAGLEARDD